MHISGRTVPPASCGATRNAVTPSFERAQAVPSELKQQQKFKDLLMTNTEKVLLSVHPVRPK